MCMCLCVSRSPCVCASCAPPLPFHLPPLFLCACSVSRCVCVCVCVVTACASVQICVCGWERACDSVTNMLDALKQTCLTICVLPHVACLSRVCLCVCVCLFFSIHTHTHTHSNYLYDSWAGYFFIAMNVFLACFLKCLRLVYLFCPVGGAQRHLPLSPPVLSAPPSLPQCSQSASAGRRCCRTAQQRASEDGTKECVRGLHQRHG